MRLALLLLVLACSGKSTTRPIPPAPPPTAAAPDPEGLPVDPNVKLGRLDNGLRYYVLRVQHGEYPGDTNARATLIIDAGSDDETAAQRGAATQMSDAFASMVSDGVDGYGGGRTLVMGDHTEVTAVTENAATAVDQLRRVADGVVFDEEVFVTPEDRYREAKRPRNIPELEEAEEATKPKRPFDPHTYDNVSSFYRTWYRPDRMAVVVVSPEDPHKVTSEISRAFASMKRPVPAQVAETEHRGTT